MLMLLWVGVVVVACSMLALWLLSIRQRNFSYVDLGWSFNFIVLAALYGALGDGDPVRRGLICGMYVLWASRLTWHLASRIIGEPEEGRYMQLRAQWGTAGNLNLKFLGFFQFQALLNLLLAMPIVLAAMNPTAQIKIIEWLGVGVWVIGLAGESLADAQLKKFKLDSMHQGEHRSRVCTVGLWSWSRHPNYFFEWIIWMGYAVFALGSSYGGWCLLLPVLMLHFLVNVTGVKPTEAQALRSKGEAYRRYQQTVSAFIPLPPRRTTRRQ